MSHVPDFISEVELEDIKKQRQEEWERVRKPADPKAAPETEYDNRCLYARIKEQREKKQFELDEAQKLKHMVRGLDSEEIGFLDYVDEMKLAEEKKRLLEEKQLIDEVHKARETENLLEHPPVAAQGSASSSKKGISEKPKIASKQAQLILGSIKRKSDSASGSSEEKRQKVTCEYGNVDSTSMTSLAVGPLTPSCEPKAAAPMMSSPHLTSTCTLVSSSSIATPSSTASLVSAVAAPSLPCVRPLSSQSAATVVVQVGVRPTAIRQLGLVPSAIVTDGNVSDASDSSISSSSSSDFGDVSGAARRVAIVDVTKRSRR